MTDDLTKRRDELADKRSKRQCTTGNPDLDKAIACYLKIGFKEGFDAGVAEMQAQVDELKDQVDKLKNQKIQLNQRWEETAKTCYEIKADCDSLNALLEIALKALERQPRYTENNEGEITELHSFSIAREALEQIKSMRGG